MNGGTGTTLGVGATLTLNASMIQPTEELICEVSVSDGYGATTIQNSSILVENTLPVIASSSVNPQNPYNDETLTCAVNATDDDGQSLSESYIWSNISSGVVIGSGAQLVLSSLLGMPGDIIECTATVNDGTGGESSDSSIVMIGNRPPSTPSVAIRPNPANTLSSLECLINSATDPDGQSVSLSFAWYVNSILQPAETAQTYGGAMSAGDNVACTVISSDGQLFSQLGSASIVIANSPPTIDSLMLTPDPLTTDDPLAAVVVYSDADGDSVNLSYIWSVNGIVIQSGSNNALTSANYVRGDLVSVSVTPSDLSSSGAAATASLTVVNSPPESQVPVLSPATPYEGADDLLCAVSGGFDADGDSISYSLWLVDGVPFGGAIDTATAAPCLHEHL